MTDGEYRYEIHLFDEDGQHLKTIDTAGGWLDLDVDRLSEECGKRVRGLRLRECLRPTAARP